MGKLTDSLKNTSQRLNALQQGIRQMQSIGEELADNTLVVAEAALRAGYAYAQAEAETVAEGDRPLPAIAPSSSSASSDWSVEALKARFGTCAKAYRYLRDRHGVTLKTRSWQAIATVLQDAEASAQAAPTATPAGDRPASAQTLESRVSQLEQQVTAQALQIAELQAQIQALLASRSRAK
ncbi:hypothetical protein [Geitlerinema sp. PCC 7407]|uniref:hypothetical protein n=1 Tax=Geitlerinema sp. PCC 7407 TaxID=1173025 RepID=UPI00029FC2D9|nr:hypothetical protein [Geitlerinema sp. PCC 7407]AFY66471.1 hypothetical protein GEI7407_1990 [Geitlerinema sp. PCC 7407]